MPKWQQSLNSFVLKVLQSSLPPGIPTYSIQSDTSHQNQKENEKTPNDINGLVWVSETTGMVLKIK
jgi:hypothetical protein